MNARYNKVDTLVEAAQALEHAANSLAVVVDQLAIADKNYDGLRAAMYLAVNQAWANLQNELELLRDLADIAAAVADCEIDWLERQRKN